MDGPPRRALALDVGGTAIKAGLVDAAGCISRRRERPTAADSGPAMEEDIARLIAHCAPAGACGDSAPPLGISLPGMLSADGRRVERAANLPGLRGYPLPARLRQRYAGSAVVLADSDAAALAEARCGAGRGAARLLVASIGTGIGVSLVENGRLIDDTARVRGLGHLVVDPQGPVCACGQRGCIEALASAAALRRTLGAALGREPSLDELNEQVARPGAAGEVALARWAHALSQGIAAWAERLAPARIVLSGGITAYGAALLERVRAEWARVCAPRGRPAAPLEFSLLGRDAALIGAGIAAIAAAAAAAGGRTDETATPV